jgi:RHH-type proline utilization regulon transcriptional repressor/proline dehydrogenase/delta 1-pyrroline-5-carboxylate dehydrogenase
VGAVVGVQPFGGEGLSGTGPKAGGPLYLYRLLGARPQEAVANQLHRSPVPCMPRRKPPRGPARLGEQAGSALAALCDHYAALSQSGRTQLLTGPTGERNSYSLLPRERVLCLAQEKADLLAQLAACLAVGSRCCCRTCPDTRPACSPLPTEARIPSRWWRTGPRGRRTSMPCCTTATRSVAGGEQARRRAPATRNGAIIGVHGLHRGETDIPLERLLIEHALSVNTAAAGGNASLMTIG